MFDSDDRGGDGTAVLDLDFVSGDSGRGRCAACGYRWPWTQCLRCHAVSAHERWYK